MHTLTEWVAFLRWRFGFSEQRSEDLSQHQCCFLTCQFQPYLVCLHIYSLWGRQTNAGLWVDDDDFVIYNIDSDFSKKIITDSWIDNLSHFQSNNDGDEQIDERTKRNNSMVKYCFVFCSEKEVRERERESKRQRTCVQTLDLALSPWRMTLMAWNCAKQPCESVRYHVCSITNYWKLACTDFFLYRPIL
jgi:hypothetical protein